MPVKLSVIINHYKEPAVLKMSLGYAKKALEQISETSEIIVTDSETIPETKEMMQEHFSDVIFLEEPKNIGFGKSVNRAIKIATGEYLFIMNADIILAYSNAIAELFKYSKEHPEVGIVGPKLLNINKTVQDSGFRFYTPLTILARRTAFGKTSKGKKILDNFLIRDKVQPFESPTPVDWLMGSALFIRRDKIEKVGMLDEKFFMYMEDVDWCRRFWEAGHPIIYNPKAVSYHYHFQSSKKKGGLLDVLLNKYTRIHVKSACIYFKKYGLKTPRYGV